MVFDILADAFGADLTATASSHHLAGYPVDSFAGNEAAFGSSTAAAMPHFFPSFGRRVGTSFLSSIAEHSSATPFFSRTSSKLAGHNGRITSFADAAATGGTGGTEKADLEYNRDALKQLTEYRAQHRRTVDGVLCAAAFVQGSQTFTSCTDAVPSPGGTSGSPWCYVEANALNADPKLANWGICAPPTNYQEMRNQVIRADADEFES